eukprot:gene3943-7153_t
MKLLTHNYLCCVLCENFPLSITAKEKTLEKREINYEFIKNFLPRLDYPALKLAAKDLNIKGLPEKLENNIQEDENALKALHELLVEVIIEEGELVCSKCSRAYPIKNRILNMVLREDEVLQKKKKNKKNNDEKEEEEEELMEE